MTLLSKLLDIIIELSAIIVSSTYLLDPDITFTIFIDGANPTFTKVVYKFP